MSHRPDDPPPTTTPPAPSGEPPPADESAPAEESATNDESATSEESAGTATPEEPAPPGSQARRRVRAAAIIAGSTLFAAAVVAVAGFAAIQIFQEDLPAVGDCLTDAASADDMSVVDCGAADAYWSVVGDDGSWRYGDFEAAGPGEVCAGHPGSQQALWVTDARSVGEATEGEVVCLTPIAGGTEDVQQTG